MTDSRGQAVAGADEEDLTTLVARVHHLLAARETTVAVAESLTGGLLAARLTDMAGSSATFRGGVVAYATELKARLLGVDADLLAEHGPVHPLVAAQMARGVARVTGAGYGVATTGVAGPGPADGHAAGTVYVAVWGPATGGGRVASLALSGDRGQVRAATVGHALGMLVKVLTDSS